MTTQPKTLTATGILNSGKPLQTTPPPKKPHNEVLFILDESGSMQHCYSTATEKLRENITATDRESTGIGQTTAVSVMSFSSGDWPNDFYRWWAKGLLPGAAHEACRRMTGSFRGTALNDAIATGVEYLETREADASLVIVITDGEECSSTKWDSLSVANLIGRKLATGTWTFAVLCPPGKKDQIVRRYCIPEGNVLEWENTIEGTRTMGDHVTTAASTYYSTTRAQGITSTRGFFTQTTDLSKVSTAAVKSNLTDISDKVKILTVDKEQNIKDFVEEKLKRPYQLGEAFYQLMKPERVAKTKGVLVREKTGTGAKKVYGGPDARAVLNLPESDARLKPGNHANFEVYVQSLSVNRKLPRGTTVVVMK